MVHEPPGHFNVILCARDYTSSLPPASCISRKPGMLGATPAGDHQSGLVGVRRSCRQVTLRGGNTHTRRSQCAGEIAVALRERCPYILRRDL